MITLLATAVMDSLFSAPLDAQTCGPTYPVSGTIFVADGSTPCGDATVFAMCGPSCSLASYGWGPHTFDLSTGRPYWEFHGLHSDYLGALLPPPDGEASCTETSPGCGTCTGTFTIPMWARFGNIKGRVISIPPGTGVSVYIEASPGPLTLSDESGYYSFANASSPTCNSVQNNWGVSVDGDGSGPGSRLYSVSPAGYPDLAAPSTGSTLAARPSMASRTSRLRTEARRSQG